MTATTPTNMTATPPTTKGNCDSGLLAAIDLGSNSFHMVIARLVHGEIRTVEKMSEKVQLGAGLNQFQMLTEAAQARALACLSRFAQRLQGMHPAAVQIVGTNALRVARNTPAFIEQAEAVLGYPVAVIAGREEARLIYLGVSHTLADDAGKRLVIDIGGGSSEFIIGERFEARELESLHMGCVSFSDRYFPDGKINKRQLERAMTHARQELQGIQRRYRYLGWASCVGASGSVKAVEVAVQTLKLCPHGISHDAMKALYLRLLDMGHADRLGEIGIRADRQSIFVAGFAILYAAFQSLGIERMDFADGALREGLLYDMVGRICHEDVRERTVLAMQERYHVDTAHAQAVEQTALAAFDQLAGAWALDADYHRDLLRWSCRLHEVGLTISHSQYHKHGAYILRYADLAGFSRQSQQALATLVRLHRRKFAAIVFETIDPDEVEPLKRLCILLRLAYLIQHPRNLEAPPTFVLTAGKQDLTLKLDAAWLAERPLTQADIEDEISYLSKANFTLKVITLETPDPTGS